MYIVGLKPGNHWLRMITLGDSPTDKTSPGTNLSVDVATGTYSLDTQEINGRENYFSKAFRMNISLFHKYVNM